VVPEVLNGAPGAVPLRPPPRKATGRSGLWGTSATQGRGGEAGSLVFGVSRSHDEQDRALGLDTYDITVGDGSRIYGGLESLVRDGDVIKVRISAEAASTLGLPEEFRIALHELPEDEKAQVSPGLRRLFELAGHAPAELVL